MPLERVSQKFKDISMSFQSNPLTLDLIALRDANAIARSVKNIITTRPGEKLFNPEFGTRITDSLFELLDQTTANEIKDEIQYSINNFEPRVRYIDSIVEPLPDENAFNVQIIYQIIGLDIPPQQLEFILLPTR